MTTVAPKKAAAKKPAAKKAPATPKTTEKKKSVGRPRVLEKMITRNVLIDDVSIEAARKLCADSVSAGIRAALVLLKDKTFKDANDYSKAAYDAQFINATQRHVVLDEATHKIAVRLGRGNISAGIRGALKELVDMQAKQIV